MDWGSLAEWATVALALPTIVYAVVQLRLTRRDIEATTQAAIAETRPYVWASYRSLQRSQDRDGVWLCVENGGRTPALDVVLSFDDGAPWRGERMVSARYPFLAESGGIRVLAPGQPLDFFVDVWEKDSVLYRVWKERSVFGVTVAYRSLDGRNYRERFELSLRDRNGTGDFKEPTPRATRTD